MSKKVISFIVLSILCIGVLMFLVMVFIARLMEVRKENHTSVSSFPEISPTGPAPTHTRIPTPTPTVIPIIMSIPKLSIQTVVEPVGITKEGNMDTPTNAKHVGWYQYGTVPGRPGNAVISGHYDTVTGKPAIFYNLFTLEIGDMIEITLSDGQTQLYTVKGKELIPNEKFPLRYVFREKTGINMNLITCGGTWDPKAKNYTKRVVVYTTYTGESASNSL